MTRLRTKGPLIPVRLPLALDAVLRAEAAMAHASPGRYAGYVLTEALAAHATGEPAVTVQVAVDPGVYAALARVGVLTAVPNRDEDLPESENGSQERVGHHAPGAAAQPAPLSLTGVVRPPMRAAPGIACPHAPGVRTAEGYCGDCGYWIGPDGAARDAPPVH